MASAQDTDYQEWRMIIVAGQILVEPERASVSEYEVSAVRHLT